VWLSETESHLKSWYSQNAHALTATESIEKTLPGHEVLLAQDAANELYQLPLAARTGGPGRQPAGDAV
jgi:hypothetical protein